MSVCVVPGEAGMEPSGSLALRLAARADWNTALPLSTAGDAGQALAGQVSGGALIVQLCSVCVCCGRGRRLLPSNNKHAHTQITQARHLCTCPHKHKCMHGHRYMH